MGPASRAARALPQRLGGPVPLCLPAAAVAQPVRGSGAAAANERRPRAPEEARRGPEAPLGAAAGRSAMSPVRAVLALVAALAAPAAAYFVSIDAHAEECFLERVPSGTKMGLIFEVAEGGFLDIDVEVRRRRRGPTLGSGAVPGPGPRAAAPLCARPLGSERRHRRERGARSEAEAARGLGMVRAEPEPPAGLGAVPPRCGGSVRRQRSGLSVGGSGGPRYPCGVPPGSAAPGSGCSPFPWDFRPHRARCSLGTGNCVAGGAAGVAVWNRVLPLEEQRASPWIGGVV